MLDSLHDILFNRYLVGLATLLLAWFIMRDTLRAALYILDSARRRDGVRRREAEPPAPGQDGADAEAAAVAGTPEARP